ncbi:hypothetical protein TSUD_372930 [Trifolium subterraneum]|uniref:Carboxypeptidase n=1 Tax=Trifolium subterraneum TaxID=3900 RepID=A0A2Z6P5A2_TRISU|nr:hypothetical protein TSUD_372930 [Trifolium subterraneum]
MIYLDSPIGVGFSFSVNQSFYYLVNDEMTGHYAPQLAQLILQTKTTKINLKGIAIGNPLLEFNKDFDSSADFLWSHGQIQDSTFELLKTQAAEEKIDVCVEHETVTYMNRKEVHNALNAKLVGITHWSTCSSVLVYNFQNLEIPTISILGTLVKSGVRVLVFSGDQDSVIPFMGTRSLIKGLAKDLGLNTTQAYRAWFRGKQVAGWTQVYGNILTFATIRGAGHAAPFYQPGRSLQLFKTFLEGKPLPNRH